MRKVYLTFGVLCELITFALGLSFVLVGLGVVDVGVYAERFAKNLDSLFYRSALFTIGVAVVLVSLRIVFLLVGSLKNRRELTLIKNERGVVKTTAQNLEKMLQSHLTGTEGVRAVTRVHITEKRGLFQLYVSVAPGPGVEIETVRERINQGVETFSAKYQPIRFHRVHLDLAFEESA